jgi:hypothetical protein
LLKTQLGRKFAAGAATLTGFYDETVGTKVVYDVDHTPLANHADVTTPNNFVNGVADPPEVTGAAGAYLPGAIVTLDLSYSDRGKMSLVFERITDASYEPITGDLSFEWVRWGRKW